MGRGLRNCRYSIALCVLVAWTGAAADSTETRTRSVVQLAIGLFLGLALALLASGALQPVLYKVNPRDAAVFVAVTITLAAASLFATFVPARRVTRIDPVVALAVE